ncbi:hypothetical protein [Picrophilus oshimae]|uniref:Thermopsin n=1 Tax=Picrophilus torridus (strain ATCC 700027 / DSM 9790 / JCM 10055 / NBRC 100828 / KAW 2/3) TaxID=1122961 RepID=A0A8G2L7L1_PICTO|nr:hypothetical protein [Picrophilus oshimae]SMD30420.1 hypothetical protein SAMN02745355_0300 [Picrophilus oshimae DSM 9789]
MNKKFISIILVSLFLIGMLASASNAMPYKNGYNYTKESYGALNVSYNGSIIIDKIVAHGSSGPFVSSGNLSIIKSGRILSFETFGNSSSIIIYFNKDVNVTYSQSLNSTVNILGISVYEHESIYLIEYKSLYFTMYINGNKTSLSNNTLYISEPTGVKVRNVKLYSIDVDLIEGEKPVQNFLNGYFEHRHAYLKIQYSNGNVSGRYIKMYYKNGVFYNLTNNITGNVIFNKMYSKSLISNVSVSPNIITRGDIMLYTNLTGLYMFHNNPTLETNILIKDSELKIYLPSTARIYNYTMPMPVGVNISAMNQSMEFSLLLNAKLQPADHIIYVNNNNNVTVFFIYGNYTVKNNVITVMSSNTSFIKFVSPPGYIKGNVMSHLLSSGRLAVQDIIDNVNSSIYTSPVYYNSSVNLSFYKHSSNALYFKISSRLHKGTIVSFFVSSSVLKSNKFYVYFDGSLASNVSLSKIANETGSAYYAYTETSSGAYIYLYIPHFSNHTIEITSEKPVTSIARPIPLTDYGIIAAVIIIIVAIVAVVLYKRK